MEVDSEIVEKVVGMSITGGVVVSCGIVVSSPLGSGMLVPCPMARGARSIEENLETVVDKVVGMILAGGVVVSCGMVVLGPSMGMFVVISS
jgi:(2Fe-2S) ferredoxin